MKPLGVLAMVLVPAAFPVAVVLMVAGRLGDRLFDWSMSVASRWRRQ